ncbi:hypothetical protein [Streptomyces sp. NPDC005209]
MVINGEDDKLLMPRVVNDAPEVLERIAEVLGLAD